MDATGTGLTVLELPSREEDNVILEGPLEACRRAVAQAGLEVDRYEGATLAMDGGRALYATATENDFACCWLKPSGLIHRGRDAYCLVMPLTVWTEG